MQQLLSGLAFIHRHNEVHRDLAPQNGIHFSSFDPNPSVLYSTISGWWKIADFGLTASATSRHLRTTTGKRGRASYRAPEIVRDTGSGYNKKADIWSLGCILFELCVGRKAFKDDFDTFQFAESKREFDIEFPHWFDLPSVGRYGDLLRMMLHPDYEKRPSIEHLCEIYGPFISTINRREAKNIWELSDNPDYFIRPENLLGTDVFSQQGLENIRWEKGLPGGALNSHLQPLERWKQTVAARKTLLGEGHVNTIWGVISLGWTYIFVGDQQRAIDCFLEACEVAEKAKRKEYSSLIISSRYGLAWAYSNARKHVLAADLLAEMVDVQNGDVATAEQLEQKRLSFKSASARNDIFWRPREEIIPKLLSIVNDQRRLLGDAHLETIQSSSLLASVYILQRDKHAKMQANIFFEQSFSVQTRLFEIEHPAILFLCELSWTYNRLGQMKEAVRIFRELEVAQKNHLSGEYPSTVCSLEALAIKLNMGPIIWATTVQNGLLGNNRQGAKGTYKCLNCRKRKIKVYIVVLISSDAVRV